MKKFIVASIAAGLLAGCGGGSSSSGGGSPEPIVVPETDSTLTETSRKGYAAVGENPAELSSLSVPAFAGENSQWVPQTNMSDDFDYKFSARTAKTNFGSGRWYNFYHSNWNGPGATYWQYDHVSVDGGNLRMKVSRSDSTDKMGIPGVNAGCISSNNQVQYPVFVEASVSMADVSLASAVWLLSPDDTQEIDILEAYPGAQNGNTYFSKFIHLSHHSFIRTPFTDYQPKDKNSWWTGGRAGYDSWGEYAWNSGNRQYTQIGVNWISPYHFEYYIDGELVRVLYDKAFATKMYKNGSWTWTYSYPIKDSNGNLVFNDGKSGGHQSVVVHAENSDDFNFELLKQARDKSSVSVIDPYEYQGGKGIHKPLDIVINMEYQDWWQYGPTDDQLTNDVEKNTMLIDWIRVYKPEAL